MRKKGRRWRTSRLTPETTKKGKMSRRGGPPPPVHRSPKPSRPRIRGHGTTSPRYSASPTCSSTNRGREPRVGTGTTDPATRHRPRGHRRAEHGGATESCGEDRVGAVLGSHGEAQRISRTHDSNPPPPRTMPLPIAPGQPPEAAAARRLRAPAPPEATVALALTSRKARDPN